jgi:protein-S-isoprenylcysteine O-methyltransferase Ste14
MRFLTIISALLYGFLSLLVFPFVFVKINILFDLPVISFLLSKWAGVILLIVGFFIWSYCVGTFGFIGRGTPVPIAPPKKLVTTGIYQWTRNPMYISALIVFLGYFFIFGYISLLIYLFLGFLFFHLFIILYEEPTLKRKFGKSYTDYCQRVCRWI